MIKPTIQWNTSCLVQAHPPTGRTNPLRTKLIWATRRPTVPTSERYRQSICGEASGYRIKNGIRGARKQGGTRASPPRHATARQGTHLSVLHYNIRFTSVSVPSSCPGRYRPAAVRRTAAERLGLGPARLALRGLPHRPLVYKPALR